MGGRSKWGMIVNEHRVPFWDDENVLKLDSCDGFTTM